MYLRFSDSQTLGHFSDKFRVCLLLADKWLQISLTTLSQNNRFQKHCTKKKIKNVNILLDPANEASGVLPNLYYLPPTGAFKSATEVPQKCHRKPSLLRGEHSEPWKVTLSLSRAKREKFPSLHTPYWCTQKCHRIPSLLRGKHSKSWKATPSLHTPYWCTQKCHR